MLNSVDLYLGAFLVLCGFALSLLNLRSLIKEGNTTFPAVLISENVLLTCIGIAFIIRSTHEMNPSNFGYWLDIEERTTNGAKQNQMNCNFPKILVTYGPLIISLVNSFLSLIIDNYMHYRMLADMKKRDAENAVQEIDLEARTDAQRKFKNLFTFWKRYFKYIAISLQWIVPVILALSMYPVNLKELTLNNIRSLDDSCMAIVDMTAGNCSLSSLTNNTDYSLELRNYIPSVNYLEMYEDEPNNNSKGIQSVVDNVFKIITNLKNQSYIDMNITSSTLYRRPKQNFQCMKVCYVENKNLLLYMFILAIASYFVPITISTIILTKIHVMDLKKNNVKMYVNRELLYNILFWTPVMFDTFLSLLLCSYSMNGMRTSIFNVIANVYQAVKNFMNTKYFKYNTVLPIE